MGCDLPASTIISISSDTPAIIFSPQNKEMKELWNVQGRVYSVSQFGLCLLAHWKMKNIQNCNFK
jgi:hypothetical protein